MVRLRELKDILDYRIEAEYFQKRFVYNDLLKKRNDCIQFSKCFSFKNGRPYDSASFKSACDTTFNNELEYNIAVARIGDVTNKRPIQEWDYITSNEFLKQKGEYLSYGDILMTLTGDPPDVGKVHFCVDNISDATWNQRVAKIAIKDKKLICNKEYAFILLSTNFCRIQIERNAKGIRQRNLGNEGLETILIPLLPSSFQSHIESLVRTAHEKLQTSRTLYSSAENLLLETLGLKDWSPSVPKINKSVRKFSFVQGVGRMDAEYFQEKYEEVEEKIKAKETFRLGDIVDIQKSIEPGSDAYQTQGIPFIRVQDLSEKGIATPSVFLDEKKYYKETLALKKDTILFSKDGSIGIAYKVDEDVKAITSGAILHLTVKDKRFLPDFLCLYLNSIATKMQAERDAGGSIIQHWKPQEIKNVLVPLLPLPTQKQIADDLQQSVALRKESKELLEKAKQEVEREIENV